LIPNSFQLQVSYVDVECYGLSNHDNRILSEYSVEQKCGGADKAEDPEDDRRDDPSLAFGYDPLGDGPCSEHRLAEEAES